MLFEQVCKQLNLLEADYFGLEYQEGSTKVSTVKNKKSVKFLLNDIYIVFFSIG